MITFELLSMQILCLGLLILTAHYGGRITRRLRVGEVVGQVLGGLIIGPGILFFVGERYPAYHEALQSMQFFTFVFLGIIAFAIGDELHRNNLKKIGHDVLLLTLIQGSVTWVLIFSSFLLLGFKPMLAAIVGSIGIATAPAASFAIMNNLEITGRIRTMLGGMVVLDDLFEMILFSLLCQVAVVNGFSEGIAWGSILGHVGRELLLAITLGLAVFVVLRIAIEPRWLKRKVLEGHSTGTAGPEFLSRLLSEMPGPALDIMIVVSGVVCVAMALALRWGLPFLITAISAGIFMSNFYSKEVFRPLRIENATAIHTLMFFALIGVHADFQAFRLENLGFIAVYVFARAAGKIGGTWLGCRITRQEKRYRKSLPKLMLPQAGVAAIEAFYVAHLLGKEGEQIMGIVIPSLILFELIGIITTERSLIRWRSWMQRDDEWAEEGKRANESIMAGPLTVSSYLHQDCILVDMDVSTTGEAIWKLIHALHLTHNIENPGKVLDLVLAQERQEGIAMDEGVAILRGCDNEIERPVLAMGILRKGGGLSFGGPDQERVSILLLALVPAPQRGLLLRILAGVARLLNNALIRERLLDAQTSAEVLNVVADYER